MTTDDDTPLHQRAMQLALRVRDTSVRLGAARFALAGVLAGVRPEPLADAEAAVEDAGRAHRKALWEWYAAAHDEIVRVSTRQDDGGGEGGRTC